MSSSFGGGSDDEELELLNKDLQDLHEGLERGDPQATRNVLDEIDQVLEREDQTLKDAIIEERRRLEAVRRELKSEIEKGDKEAELGNTIEEEWAELVNLVSGKDKDWVGGGEASQIQDAVQEIDQRITKLLEIQRSELEDLEDSDEDLEEGSIAEFLVEDLKEAAETHQRIAIYRQMLLKVMKQTHQAEELARKGAYAEDERARSDNVVPELNRRAVQTEDHIEDLQNGWMPQILEEEKKLVEELEAIGEELESLIEIDEEIMEEIKNDTDLGRGGSTLSGLKDAVGIKPPGQLVSKLRELNSNGNLDTTLAIIEEDILPKLKELEKEDFEEERTEEKMLGEVKDHINRHKDLVQREKQDLEDLEREREETPQPAPNYPPAAQAEAENLVGILRTLFQMRDGEYSEWDMPLDAEIGDLNNRVEEVHRVMDEEVSDISDFEGRVREAQGMIDSWVNNFQRLKDRNNFDSIKDLPTDQDIINRGDRPDDYTTVENLVRGGNIIGDRGLNALKNPEDNTGILVKLEEDIKKIYGDEDSEVQTFSEIEEEFKDIERKFEMVESGFERYENLMEELANADHRLSDQRGRADDYVFTAAATIFYSGEAGTPEQKHERLEQEIQDLERWLDGIRGDLESIERVIYTDDDSIISEETVQEEQIEKAVKELMQAIEEFESILRGEASSSTPSLPEDIASRLNAIETSLRNIAQRATELRERADVKMNEFREWAEVAEREREEAESMESETDDLDDIFG